MQQALNQVISIWIRFHDIFFFLPIAYFSQEIISFLKLSSIHMVDIVSRSRCTTCLYYGINYVCWSCDPDDLLLLTWGPTFYLVESICTSGLNFILLIVWWWMISQFVLRSFNLLLGEDGFQESEMGVDWYWYCLSTIFVYLIVYIISPLLHLSPPYLFQSYTKMG